MPNQPNSLGKPKFEVVFIYMFVSVNCISHVGEVRIANLAPSHDVRYRSQNSTVLANHFLLVKIGAKC